MTRADAVAAAVGDRRPSPGARGPAGPGSGGAAPQRAGIRHLDDGHLAGGRGARARQPSDVGARARLGPAAHRPGGPRRNRRDPPGGGLALVRPADLRAGHGLRAVDVGNDGDPEADPPHAHRVPRAARPCPRPPAGEPERTRAAPTADPQPDPGLPRAQCRALQRPLRPAGRGRTRDHGRVLDDRFRASYDRFAIRSTVLPPAAITSLNDDPAVESLSPLRYVRSITAPLSPRQARRFRDKFSVFVLNGYGQAEIGEVIGWTAADANRPRREDRLDRPTASGRADQDRGRGLGPGHPGPHRRAAGPPPVHGRRRTPRTTTSPSASTGPGSSHRRPRPRGRRRLRLDRGTGRATSSTAAATRSYPEEVEEVLRLAPGGAGRRSRRGARRAPRRGARGLPRDLAPGERCRAPRALPLPADALQGPDRVPPDREPPSQRGGQAPRSRLTPRPGSPGAEPGSR